MTQEQRDRMVRRSEANRIEFAQAQFAVACEYLDDIKPCGFVIYGKLNSYGIFETDWYLDF